VARGSISQMLPETAKRESWTVWTLREITCNPQERIQTTKHTDRVSELLAKGGKSIEVFRRRRSNPVIIGIVHQLVQIAFLTPSAATQMLVVAYQRHESLIWMGMKNSSHSQSSLYQVQIRAGWPWGQRRQIGWRLTRP